MYVVEIFRLVKEKQRAEFKKMLKELDPESITAQTTWKEMKGKLKSDPRYKAVGSSTEREKLFLEHAAELLAERSKRLGNKRELPEHDEEQHAPAATKEEEENLLMEILHTHVKQTNVTSHCC